MGWGFYGLQNARIDIYIVSIRLPLQVHFFIIFVKYIYSYNNIDVFCCLLKLYLNQGRDFRSQFQLGNGALLGVNYVQVPYWMVYIMMLSCPFMVAKEFLIALYYFWSLARKGNFFETLASFFGRSNSFIQFLFWTSITLPFGGMHIIFTTGLSFACHTSFLPFCLGLHLIRTHIVSIWCKPDSTMEISHSQYTRRCCRPLYFLIRNKYIKEL